MAKVSWHAVACDCVPHFCTFRACHVSSIGSTLRQAPSCIVTAWHTMLGSRRTSSKRGRVACRTQLVASALCSERSIMPSCPLVHHTATAQAPVQATACCRRQASPHCATLITDFNVSTTSVFCLFAQVLNWFSVAMLGTGMIVGAGRGFSPWTLVTLR
jgi:hypothetical protein